jgi:esterase FrsA
MLMGKAKAGLRIIAGLAGLALASGMACAQIATPRTLDELKTEIQTRADKRVYPVSQLDSVEVREALAKLKSQDRDEWAQVWGEIGDRHFAKAKALEGANKAEAAKSFEHAMEYFLFARFPLEDSPGTYKAYEKMLDAFAGYSRSIDPPIEAVKFNYDGKEIVGYLRKPKGVAKPPVVMTIGGLDGRKENAAIRNAAYLQHGVAFFALDMPGTGQTRILIEPGAEKVFSAAIDALLARDDVDGKRIVAHGGSWGGHWSARLAYSEKDRLAGAIVQGGPVHHYFQPEWQKKALGTREYLFGLFEARAAVYGVKTLDDFLAYGPKMSLIDAGWLTKPSAPMFVLNGVKDTQVPIADLYALLNTGGPKDAWVNPEGGHMGRMASMNDQQIFEKVVLPWAVRRLNPGS